MILMHYQHQGFLANIERDVWKYLKTFDQDVKFGVICPYFLLSSNDREGKL